MTDDNRRTLCTIDHANTQKELAQLTPYQFWLDQLKYKGAADRSHGESGDEGDRPRRAWTRS